MQKAIEAFGSLVRSLMSLAVLGLIGFGGWIGYHEFYLPGQSVRRELAQKTEELAKMAETLELKQQEVERLDTALRLVKVDHRLAQLAVLNQWRRPEDNQLMTTVGFAEVDDQGRFLDGYRSFTIEGDVVYVDAWVAKFLDEHVEQGVPMRSTSLCLFRRLFGENQSPSDGFVLDAVGAQPLAYGRGRETTDLERDIWANFWEYANDPARAQTIGLRALQGEAPSIRLVPDKMYWVYLRASDGLTIKATERPRGGVANSGSDAEIQPAAYSQPAAESSLQRPRALPNGATRLPTTTRPLR